MGAGKMFLRFHDPLFGPQFLPARYGCQHRLPRDLKRESADMAAWEISALMTAFELLFVCAGPDGARRGELKYFFGSATVTGHLLRFCSENRGQLVFKFLITVAVRCPNRTKAGNKAAGHDCPDHSGPDAQDSLNVTFVLWKNVKKHGIDIAGILIVMKRGV